MSAKIIPNNLKLNKAQRNRVYKEALAHYEQESLQVGYMKGLCYSLRKVLKNHDYNEEVAANMTYYEARKKSLPEFFKAGQFQNRSYWFDFNEEGRNKRIKVLEKCIAETNIRRKVKK